MATVMPGLLPDTQGVQFTSRPVLKTREASARASAKNGRSSSLGSPAAESNGVLSPNASLSSIEVEALLREKVRAKSDSIRQAFSTYDADQNASVTKGEFRRVLESFCFPLTTDQFEAVTAKVDKNSNGTIRYTDFMEKFCGTPVPAVPSGGRERYHSAGPLGPPRFLPPSSAREINVDMIEKMLRDKMKENTKSVLKALQLFDYNRDSKIQRHEMRRVIENYCFKLSDQQFDKLWQRYDFHHTGLVNYKEFLSRLGVAVDQRSKPPSEGAKAAMTWQNRPSSQSRSLQQRRDDEAALQSMNFDQIEIEFRNRMKNNYLHLKKLFISFDRHLDGFISIEDLHSILNQFTLPMSKQLFGQIMERTGVRGTGKISWEAFLEKFQDPQSSGNGQTIPIKPSHKFFPIREGMEIVEAGDIWRLLYKHVQNHYPSIKNAFLQFDITRKGKVTRKELRDVIEKFTFRLSNEQFKELMVKLDPQHTNDISYHKFLDLFEEKDSIEGHKWLNSVHKVNDNNKPTILAWETVEELLREKITEYWKNVSSVLVDYDYKGDGHISHRNLKKVLDNYVLPVSDEHFDSMVKRCEDRTDKMVNYVEFLEKLRVDVRPGDMQGLSTQIFAGSISREQKRMEDQDFRNMRMGNRALGHTNDMTADEVIARLKDRMSQHNMKIREAFLACDKKGRGTVSKAVFRQVLATFGMFMSDEQFNIFVSKLGFHNGVMKYHDFITSFEDPRVGGPSEDIQRVNNHRVNPIRGDNWGMTLEEVENKLRSKLRENFANLRGAFYKFDENHTGAITKDNFRRLLDAFMCFMSDEQFEALCAKHGITKKTRITYKDFLERFEVRDSPEGHKWLNSVHRYNSPQPSPEMSAEEAFEVLRTKAHRQWKDLSQAFIKIDRGGGGVIKRKDLRALLNQFIMPVPPEEFPRLWEMFDNEKKGYISYDDFLYKIGASEFTPGDHAGMSTKIIDHSRKHLEDHNEQQQQRHERITVNQAQKVKFMTAEQVERCLRDKIRDSYQDAYTAFRKYDLKKKGYLSVNEIQKVLIDFNFFLDDEQFFTLLDRIGLKTNKSKLNYEEFLHAFEDGRKSSYGHRPQEVRIEEYTSMTPAEAEIRLREMVAGQADVLERAFCSFDKDNSSLVPIADFRRVLDLFCFKLTKAQFQHIQPKLYMTGDKVNYNLFLDSFSMSEQEDSERWLASLQKSLRSQTPWLMPIDEVQEKLHEAVSAHIYQLTTAFTECDYANLGVVSKEDFKSIMSKNLFRLSDEQFEKLWSSLTVNEYGNVDYREFIKRYSSEDAPPPIVPATPAPQAQRPMSTMTGRRSDSRLMMGRRSLTRLELRPGSMMSRAHSRMSTPLVNAESAEQKMKDAIYRNWKSIQSQCRQLDTENSGTINVVDLKEILMRYGVDLQGEDFLDILTKYDLKDNGRFCYVDFLRNFILNLKPQDDSALTSRRMIHTPKLVKSPGETNSFFYDAMLRLRECVVGNWKEMRRSFRAADMTGSGLVDSLEFRRILRQFNVNLSEDEFFHLLSYYDKNMDGNIGYNEFIRAYLKRS